MGVARRTTRAELRGSLSGVMIYIVRGRCVAKSGKGSLADVLRAGGWSSSAYLKYLRSAQLDDKAVAQMAIELSESEED